VLFSLSGHVSGAQKQQVHPVNGRNIYDQMRGHVTGEGNYDGYIRILHFIPATGMVNMTTYSPVLDNWLTDAPNQFSWNVGIGAI